MTGSWVGTAIGMGWLATYLSGGSHTAVPHVFYLPIVVAAVRFGAAGAFVVSLVAGLVVGPLMPLDVAAGLVQSPGNWATRLVVFLVIGQFTAYLVRHRPIVELASGDVVGAEALVRWDHPTRGLIGPDVFVSEAERIGCVGDITRFVLTQACAQVADWRCGVLSDCERFKIAVNLSGADLGNDGLPLFVGDVRAETGLRPPPLALAS